jgi:hypothetical protein
VINFRDERTIIRKVWCGEVKMSGGYIVLYEQMP